MKTDNVPALITLIGCCTYIALSFRKGLENTNFFKELLLVLLIFYIIGVVVKLVLDYGMKIMDDSVEDAEENVEDDDDEEEKEEDQDASDEEKLENIDSMDEEDE